MVISADVVKVLRNKTGARLMDCKEALVAVNGDSDAAVDWLRKKNLDCGSDMTKPATEGRLCHKAADGAVTLVEMGANTDFVAANAEFRDTLLAVTWLAHDNKIADIDGLNAMQTAVGSVKDRVTELAGKLGENVSIKRVARFEGSVGIYVHSDNKQAAMVELEGVAGELAEKIGKDICMHIVFAKPAHLSRSDVPSALVEKEQKFVGEKVASDPKNAKKPANIMEKIVAGQMNKFYSESVLVDQPYYKDGAKSVGQVLKELGDIKVKRFVHFHVGV